MDLHKLDLPKLEQLFYELFSDYIDLSRLKSAYEFSKKAHKGQSRKFSKREFIIHPLRMVIRLYAEFGVEDSDVLIAALLHDTVEDTLITLQEIGNKFGDIVKDYVSWLTRNDANDSFLTALEKFNSKQKKYAALKDAPYEVKLIKTMDILDNMSDWTLIKSTDQLAQVMPRWLKEAKELYIPFARTVGTEFSIQIQNLYERVINNGFAPMQQ